MKTVFLLFILLPVIIVGCAQSPDGPKLPDSPEWIEKKMYTTEADLPSSAVAGEPVIFTLRSGTHNACWKFSHIGINASGNDVFITAYMKRSPEDFACADVGTTVVEEGAYFPEFPGEYRFRFWRSDTLTLDYTVIAQ